MNKQEQIENQASYWYSQKKEGLSKLQNEAFLKWFEKSEHKQAYTKLEKLEDIFINTFDDEDINELENEVLEEIKNSKKSKSLKYIGIAASFIIVLFIGLFQSYNYFVPSFEHTLISQVKPINNYKLPDGSDISIDAKSKLNIQIYKNQRHVNLLEGQALFDIAKDKNRPFIIDTKQTQIEVLGTKFEINTNKNQIDIKVIEGKVKVSYINPLSNNTKVLSLLTKGEQLSLNKYGKVLNFSKTSIENIALWQKNKINFDNHSIKNAVEEFSKYIEKEIIINNKDIALLPITGTFYLDKSQKFFEAITLIYPISIKTKNNTIYINKKTPN